MIAGTDFAPGKAFIQTAHAMLDAMAAGEFGKALGGIDANDDGRRWSAKAWRSECELHIEGKISSATGIKSSARPQLICIEEKNIYELRHAIPVEGRWSNCRMVLRFSRKPRTSYFHVQLLGVEICK